MNYLKNLIAGVTTKVWIVTVSALVALLSASVTLNYYQNEKVLAAHKSEESFRLINIGLNQTIADLQEEIRTKPTQYIEIVREVDKELCEGSKIVDQILALKSAPLQNSTPARTQQNKPSTGGSSNEADNEDSYVDIDGLLSPELKRLLQ